MIGVLIALLHSIGLYFLPGPASSDEPYVLMSWAKSTPFQPKAVCCVGHERVRVRVIPGTDEPRDHELRVGIQRGVGPVVARTELPSHSARMMSARLESVSLFMT